MGSSEKVGITTPSGEGGSEEESKSMVELWEIVRYRPMPTIVEQN